MIFIQLIVLSQILLYYSRFILKIQYIQNILDQKTFPQIFPYFNANEVSEEHQNEIVVMQILKLKEGKEKYESNNDLELMRQFAYKIINDEFREEQEKNLGNYQKYLPIQDYDFTKTDYLNLRHWQMKHKDNYKLEILPDNQYIYAYQFKDKSEGCQHYIRGCQMKCETCKKYYPCRLCHDDQEDHLFPRKETKFVKCNKCQKEQPFNDKCIYCNHIFGTYVCYICKMLCSLGFNAKPNYHCEKCKVCMVETKDESKHCDKCNRCFKIEYIDTHCCIKAKDTVCPICYQDTERSTLPSMILDCGHSIHSHCLQQWIKTNKDTCPLCKKCIYKLDELNEYYEILNQIIDSYLINPLYENMYEKLLCNQCGMKFQCKYTPLQIYKCNKCQYYNTTSMGIEYEQDENIQFMEQIRRYTDTDNIKYVLVTYFNKKDKQLSFDELQKEINFDIEKDFWLPALLNILSLNKQQNSFQKLYKQIKNNKKKQYQLYLREIPAFFQRQMVEEFEQNQNDEDYEQYEEYTENSQSSDIQNDYNEKDSQDSLQDGSSIRNI